MKRPTDDAQAMPSDTFDGAASETGVTAYVTSRSHDAALEGLRTAVLEHTSLLVLIGEPGAGKTFVMRRLRDELAYATTPVFCPAAGLDFQQILSFVFADGNLGTTTSWGVSDAQVLAARLGERSRPAALLIDDADRMHGDALDQVLRLSTAVERRQGRLHVVLSGGPALQGRLKRARSSHPSVARAVFARLTRLRQEEAASLLTRRIASGHAEPLDVPREAMQRLVDLADGLPGALVALHEAAASRARARADRSLTVQDVEDAAAGSRTGPEPRGRARAPDAGQPGPTDGEAVSAEAATAKRPASSTWRTALLSAVGSAAFVLAASAVVASLRGTGYPVAAPVPPAERPDARTAGPSPPARHREPVAGSAADDSGGGPEPSPTSGGAERVTTGAIAEEVRLASLAPVPAPDRPSAGAISAVPAAAPRSDGLGRAQPSVASAEPAAPASSIEPEAAIGRAWDAFHRKALTTPARDSAVKWAEVALAASPGDPSATEVLRAVIDTYLHWSSTNFERGRFSASAMYLGRAQGLSRHGTPTQLAAMRVLGGQLADRTRRGGGQYYMDAPKWLNDLDAWLRTLPLPK